MAYESARKRRNNVPDMRISDEEKYLVWKKDEIGIY